MKNKLFILGLCMLAFLAACGGGEEPVAEVADQPSETAAQAEDDGQVDEAESGEEAAVEEPSEESANTEDDEDASEEMEEPEVADESDMPLPEPADGMALTEVPDGGFAFAAPAGYEVTVTGDSAEVVAENGDPDVGPQFFLAGGPLEGVTTEVMAGFMASSLQEDDGYNVGELTELSVNDLSGYAADYDGMNGDVAVQGRLVVLGNDTQAFILFGNAPADLWASSTAAEFEALASSVALMEMAQEAAESEEKSEKPATTATGGEQIAVDPSAAGLACFGTEDAAVSCITADGSWEYFSDDNSPLGGNRVAAMTVCPDGTLLMGHLFGISAFSGGEWREYSDDWGTGSIDAIDCDATGGIWIAHFQGVSTFDGSSWTTYGSELLEGVDDPSGLVHDLTLTDNGTVWAVTSNTIASFDGAEWTVYDEAALGDLLFFEEIVIGSDGQPRAIHDDGVLTFDGAEWTSNEGDFFSAQAGAIDAQNNVWIGTFSDGLYQLSGGSWGVESLATGMSSNSINDVVIDDAGRIWVGTDYGLNVFDGSGWQVYRMDNSELADNGIRAMAVVGAGPVLPAPVDEPTGSMVGSLTLDGEPFAGTLVEICVESISGFYDGPTPCADQQLFLSTTTADDGSFALEDVPEGYYVITAETPDGWARLTTEFGFGSERTPVFAGEETDIGELVITSEDE